MKVDMKKITEKVSGASVGVAVAAAFLNVALIVIQLVKTVSEESEKHQEE